MSKNNMHFIIPILILTVLAGSCQTGQAPAACRDALGCVELAPGEPLKLGVIQALSSGPAVIGQTQLNMLAMAMDERAGMLGGHPIETLVEDEFCSAEGGSAAALKITADPQVVAILGTTCSGAAVRASKVMSAAGLVMVSGLNTAPSLTSANGHPGPDWQRGYFRTSINDIERGRAAAEYAYTQLALATAATVNDGDAFTLGLTETFARRFTELGGELVLSAKVNKGDTDMLPVLEAIAFTRPQIVFFSLFQPEADYLVRQIELAPGLENTLFLSGGMMLESFIESIGQSGIGLHFIDPTTPESQAVDELKSAYTQRFGEAPQTNAYLSAFDAANLLLSAIEAVAIAGADGSLQIGRQALRDHLYATTNFPGVQGSLTCDRFGDCGFANLVITRLDDPAAGLDGLRKNVLYNYMSQP